MKRIFSALLLLTFHFSQAQKITGVLGAFPPELVLLKSKMTEKRDTVISETRFTIGILSGKNVVLAETGVGKVNAAITTTLMIEHFKPADIVFSGIAGGVDPKVRPGDLVIGTKIGYHDFGAVTDLKMEYRPTKNPLTGVVNPTFFTCDSALVKTAVQVSKGLKFIPIQKKSGNRMPSVQQGIIVTGDVFVSSAKVVERLRKDLDAAATEMEGAAIAQACYQRKTPFLIIRSMSDNANEKAGDDMADFYDIAAANAATLVMAVLEATN